MGVIVGGRGLWAWNACPYGSLTGCDNDRSLPRTGAFSAPSIAQRRPLNPITNGQILNLELLFRSCEPIKLRVNIVHLF
ncbi:MAG: hypothetical protein RLZZ511_3835 [Cyanobacteriota bacterium]|jgi:hypothetical protein